MTPAPTPDFAFGSWPQEEEGAAGALYNAMVWHTVPHLLITAVRVGLADALGDRAVPVDELAAACGLHVAPLTVVLHGLAAVGVCEPDGEGWRLGPLGAELRSGSESGVPEALLAMGERWHWANFQLWLGLEETLRTGVPAYEAIHGAPLFADMDRDGELAASFQRFMSDRSRFTVDAVLDVLAVEPGSSVVDVGGGRGDLAIGLLRRHPGARAVLFDRPAVVASVTPPDDVAERFGTVAGDFLASVPPGGDLYLLKEVVHNWDDRDAVTILTHCRAGLRPGGRVVVCESPLLASGRAALAGIGMYLAFGGRQRSLGEFRRLLAAAGLALVDVRPTSHPMMQLVVAEAAPS